LAFLPPFIDRRRGGTNGNNPREKLGLLQI
jgi:hypothetical protein